MIKISVSLKVGWPIRVSVPEDMSWATTARPKADSTNLALGSQVSNFFLASAMSYQVPSMFAGHGLSRYGDYFILWSLRGCVPGGSWLAVRWPSKPFKVVSP